MNDATTTLEVDAAEPLPLRDDLCRQAMSHFGRFGFDETMLEMSIATDTDLEVLTELFGSVEGMRAACDEYLQSTIATAKTEALVSPDPAEWAKQIAEIESYVPMMTYLVRSLEEGDPPSRLLLQRMTDNAEQYLEAAVRAGTVRPSRDPRGRARLLALFAGGGFLLFYRTHPTPHDMAAVLRDYARDLVVPALELYTYGVLTDDSMFTALTGGGATS